jgi:hypothetical protein
MILFQIKKFRFQHKVDAFHLGNRSKEIMSYAARILFIESFLLLLKFKLLDLIDFVHTDNNILFISNHKRFYLDCYINISWDNSKSIERTISFFVRFVIVFIYYIDYGLLKSFIFVGFILKILFVIWLISLFNLVENWSLFNS